MPRELRFSTQSIQGRRDQNQDSVLAERFPGDGLLMAVADGMGGHAAGEVASALALETLLKAIRAGESLEAAVRLANWQVHKRAQDPGRYGMGTTLTAMYLEDDRFFLANVGDSRAYRLSRRGIRQLTADHSFVAEALKRGHSEKDALASPWRDALTRSIGVDENVEVDLFGPFPVEDDTAILLCSDGLHKALDRREIGKIFLASEDLHEAAKALVEAAFQEGSDDNISVAIAEFGAFPRRRARSGPETETGPAGKERRGRGSPETLDEEGSDPDPGQPPQPAHGEGPLPAEAAVIIGDPEADRPGAPSPVETGGSGPRAPDTAGSEDVPQRVEDGSRTRHVPPAPPASEPGLDDALPWGAETDRSRRGDTGDPVAEDLRMAPRREIVAPWDMDRNARPKIVGGPRRRKRRVKPVLLTVTAAVIVAIAALLYLG